MLLTVDIGNTNICIGAHEGDEIRNHWRLATSKKRTSDEYGIMLEGLFASSGINKKSIKGAVAACVVPSLRDVLNETIMNYAGVKPLFVEPGVKTGMPILTDNPKEVGADRIVNAVAAYAIHKKELIVVDMGTAITFDHVTKKGEYAGGVIAPGIGVASEALFVNAAKLPKVDLSHPEAVIGKNTVDSLRSGIFYGFASLIDGIIEKIKKEVGGKPLVIATGGHSPLMAKAVRSIDTVDEFLVLKGLKLIYEVNSK